MKKLTPTEATERASRVCTFTDCDKPQAVYNAGLCSGHYAQIMRGEELHTLREVAPHGSRAGAVCKYDECGRQVYAKGYCTGHYTQLRTGQELRTIRKNGTRSECSFHPCSKMAETNGLCETHRGQKRRGVELSILRSEYELLLADAYRQIDDLQELLNELGGTA